MLNTYRDKYVIARLPHNSEISECLSQMDSHRLMGVELLSPDVDAEALTSLGPNVAVDLMLRDIGTDLTWLEQYGQLRQAHNVVAVVPVVPGFDRVVRDAVSCGLPVVLRIDALEDFDCDKVLELLDFYAHSPGQNQPIEFFHSMSRAFFAQQPITMWHIMREDPSEYRYVMDDGTEVISQRLSQLDAGGDLAGFVERLQDDLLLELGECSKCGFFRNCGGYFKVPDCQFQCTNIKKIFRTLKDKVTEIRRDLAKFGRS